MSKRNILSFTTTGDGPGIIAQKKPSRSTKHRYCDHQKVWLDEDRRLIHCRDCKVFLEPYDWIVLMARRHLWRFSSLEETKRLCGEADARLVELRKEEANTKARIRNMLNKSDVDPQGKYGEALQRRKEWKDRA